MLMVIMICTGIVHNLYSTYLFGVTPNICINIHRDVNKHNMLRDDVRVTGYFDTQNLKDLLGVVYGWVSHRRGGGHSSNGGGVQVTNCVTRVEANNMNKPVPGR